MAISFSRPDPASPASVSSAQFPTSRRGYDQTEVRDFLRMVAAEQARLQERERFLERELRAALMSTPNMATIDEETAIRLLGEEAARVLQTAREAAVQIRARAEEGSARLLREATDEAQRLREEAEIEAARRRQDSAADSEAELQMAKQQGRDMVNEARAYRERVLSELARRRELARQQIEQLIHGRDRLLQAFERSRIAAVEVMAELTPLGEPSEYVNLQPTTGPIPIVVTPGVAIGEDGEMTEEAAGAGTDQDIDTDIDTDINANIDGDAAPIGESPSGAPQMRAAARDDEHLADVVVVDFRPMDGADSGADAELAADDSGSTNPAEEPKFLDAGKEDDDRAAPEAGSPAGQAGEQATIESDSGSWPAPTSDEAGGAEAVGLDVHDAATGADAAQAGEPEADLGKAAGLRLVGAPGAPNGDATGEPPANVVELFADANTTEINDNADTPDTADIADIAESQETESAAETTPSAGSRGGTVDDLFARLRASRTDSVVRQANDRSIHRTEQEGGEIATTATASPESSAGIASDEASDDDSMRDDTEAVIVALIVSVSRKLKRVLADEQNEVLDTLRRKEPVRAIDALLPWEAEQADRYAEAVHADLVSASVAGARGSDDGNNPAIVRPASDAVTNEIVAPLREGLTRCIDKAGGSNSHLANQVRSLYREWKIHRIDEHVEDIVRLAFDRGALTVATS